MNKLNKLALSGLFCTSAAFFSSLAGAVESYTITDLGELSSNPLIVNAINDNKAAAGYSFFANSVAADKRIIPAHGFAWENDIFTDLGALPGGTDQSVIFGLNNGGMATGYSVTTVERGIYTNINAGTIEIIPPFITDAPLAMRGLSVNDAGVIVGYGYFEPTDDVDPDGKLITSPRLRGFLFDTASATLTRLDPLDYDKKVVSASVRDINQNGRFVGWSQKYIGSYLVENIATRSFYGDLAEPNTLIELQLGTEKEYSFPWSINQNNKVVGKKQGVIKDGRNYYSAFIYDIATQAVTDIGRLKNDYLPDFKYSLDISIAFDINDVDQVVGSALVDVVPNTYHAFIYENGETKDLNKLVDCQLNMNNTGANGWVFYEAKSINKDGVIVGNGLYQSEPKGLFKKRAFLLTPNPGVAPKACPVENTDDSGSGSIPVAGLCLLLFAGLFRRVKSRRVK